MKTNNNLLFLILIVAIIFTAASIIFFTYSIHEQKKANELRKENYDLKVQEINSKFDILDEKISRIEKSIEKISKKKTIRTYYSEDKNGNLGVVAIIDEVKECEKVVDSVFTSCIEPVTKTPKKQVSKKVSKKQVIKKDNCCDSLLNKTKETNLILKRIELKIDSSKMVSVVPEIKKRKLKIEINKTSFLNGRDLQTNLLDYNSAINHLPEKGFSKDSLIWTYKYVNKNLDSIALEFNSFVSKNDILFNIISHNLKTGIKEFLFLEKKEIQGLEAFPLKQKWEYEYFEKTINESLMKNGNWKFWGGLTGLAISGGSLYYWANQPDARYVHLPNGKTLVSGLDRQRRNSWGEGLSIFAGAVSTYFIIDGFLDKKAAVSFQKNGISLNYKIH